eukprot:scaffold1950_cov75-Cyclotella_meneghiniana.AAC.8
MPGVKVRQTVFVYCRNFLYCENGRADHHHHGCIRRWTGGCISWVSSLARPYCCCVELVNISVSQTSIH